MHSFFASSPSSPCGSGLIVSRQQQHAPVQRVPQLMHPIHEPWSRIPARHICNPWVHKLLLACMQAYGKIDILVSNAAVSPAASECGHGGGTRETAWWAGPYQAS